MMKQFAVLTVAVAAFSIGVGVHADPQVSTQIQVAQAGESEHVRRGRAAGLKCPWFNYDRRRCSAIGACVDTCDYNRNGAIGEIDNGERECDDACKSAQESVRRKR